MEGVKALECPMGEEVEEIPAIVSMEDQDTVGVVAEAGEGADRDKWQNFV